MLTQGTAQGAGIDQVGDPLQQLALLGHVGGFEHAAGEHELPVEGGALALQHAHVERAEVVDHAEAALWGDAVAVLRIVLIGVGQRGDQFDGLDTQRLQLRQQRLAVVDDVVRAQALDPFHALGAGGGGDHGEFGQLTR